jgi:ParB-like chromosome segregation protein Spo0J
VTTAPPPTIIETTMERIDSLKPYHLNPRRGDTAAVEASIDAFGQFKAIVCNRGSLSKGGYEREVLAGNHTLRAMKAKGHAEILVHWIDVDDDTAKRIVVADNRTSDLATNDDHVLAELLTSIENLDGVGYTPYDLDALAALLEDEITPDDDDLQDALDESDKAGWPTIKIQVDPTTKAQFDQLPGDTDPERFAYLMELAG